MLVAVAADALFPVVVAISLFFAVLMFVRRGSRTLRNSLVVRDGRPALSDEVRTRLDKRGLDVAKIEDLVVKTYTVNERGEIVMRGESTETETRSPATPAANPPEPDSSARAKPDPATNDDRFHSAWEEQDAGPSIWDKDEKAAFWGDAEKSE
jgi:hypothetical protein